MRHIPLMLLAAFIASACSEKRLPQESIPPVQRQIAYVDTVIQHIRWEQVLHIRVRLSILYGGIAPPDSLFLGQVAQRFSALTKAEEFCRMVRSGIVSGSIAPGDTLSWKLLRMQLQEIDHQLMKEEDLRPSDNRII